jgi:hypothetical protein
VVERPVDQPFEHRVVQVASNSAEAWRERPCAASNTGSARMALAIAALSRVRKRSWAARIAASPVGVLNRSRLESLWWRA